MEQLGLTVFDVAVIAVAIFGAAIGMSSGFAHSVLFIASWVAAGWIAVHFSNLIQPQVQQLVANPELAYFVSMLVVFVGALIVLVMLTNAFSRSVRGGPLAKPDRILGAGFGAFCAWVVMGTAFLFYSYLGPKALPPPVEGGATFPMIKDMANFVEPYLPPGFRTRLQQKPVDSMPNLGPMPSPQSTPSTPDSAPTDNNQSQ
ncbi:CvpA family protein [Enhydrobacter sp.]|jgi:membrane protein required for colicin V production|uniref:CvpA family protein n=1 Tax=Enhydrobacter sp. TaxID=1894999 RepID=UPI00261795B9|nr:CvpA family protein [Enhydrobacter sp.]WIM13284.1 MAG: Colicin V production protein [Enhydrobacter sp.]